MAAKQRIPLCLIIMILCLYALDQITKWAIVLRFEMPTPYWLDRVPVIEGGSFMNFDLVRLHNTGVAFGFGNGTAWAPFFFLGIQIVALVVLVILFRRGVFFNRTLRVAWAFLMVGVLGNMTDRLTQGFFLPGAEQLGFCQNLINGYVVDFLDFSFPWIVTEMFPDGYHWPSFNVADSCVCTAAALFIIVSIFTPEKKEENKEGKKEEPQAADEA